MVCCLVNSYTENGQLDLIDTVEMLNKRCPIWFLNRYGLEAVHAKEMELQSLKTRTWRWAEAYSHARQLLYTTRLQKIEHWSTYIILTGNVTKDKNSHFLNHTPYIVWYTNVKYYKKFSFLSSLFGTISAYNQTCYHNSIYLKKYFVSRDNQNCMK